MEQLFVIMRKINRSHLCILVSALSLVLMSQAAFAGWSTNGPYHKNVKVTSVSPQHSNIVYAGAFGWGVFKSTDGGSSWYDYQNGMTNTYVRSLLAFSDTVVMAGTNDGVYKTTDGGLNWTHVLATQNSVRALAVDPSTGSVYAGTYGTSLYKSTNAGATWAASPVHDPTTANDTLFHIWSIAVYGKDSVYVGGSILDIPAGQGGALFLTSNGGTTWIQAQYPTGIRYSIRSIAISPDNPANVLIVGTSINGVYLSSDGALTFTNISATAPAPSLPDLHINTVGFNPNYYYAGTEVSGGFYYRTISPASGWQTGTALPGAPAAINGITIDALNRNVVYASMDSLGLYKSTDAGVTWFANNSGMLGIAGRSVRLNGNGSLILGTDFGDGIWNSTDQGTTWKRSDTLSTANAIPSIGISNSPSLVYASAYGLGVLKSTNGGIGWNPTDTTVINHFIRPVEVHPTDANLVYAGTGNGVFKSTNGGTSWFAVNSGIPFGTSIRSMALNRTNPNVIYVGSDSSYLFRSTNAGGSWSQSTNANGFLSQDMHIRTITINQNNTNMIYAGSDSGRIYKSTDGGIQWSLLYKLPATHSVRKILIHPAIDKIFFATTFGDGIFFSADSGVHWSQFNDGLTDMEIYTIESDNSSPLNLYAGSGHSGVFHTTFTYSNRAPFLTPIGNKAGFVGYAINFTITAKDSDLTIPALSAYGLPPGASFIDSGNGHGGFRWIPSNSSIGAHAVIFVASDGSLSDSETVVITVSDSTGIAIQKSPLESGWNLISVQLNVNDFRAFVLYPAAKSRAFSFNGSYVAKDTMQNGLGYWIKYPAADTVNIGGLPLMLDTIGVRASWNMIGSLSTAIPLSGIHAIDSAVVISNLFSYSTAHGYAVADSIRPGRGYWVKVNHSGRLALNTSPVAVPAGSYLSSEQQPLSDGPPVNTLGTLTIKDARGNERDLYVSVALSPRDVSKYELPPAPPAEVFDVRFASQSMVANSLPSADVEEFPVLISGGEYPMTLTWNMKEGREYDLRSLDAQGHLQRNSLSGSGRVVLNYAQPGSVVLEGKPATSRVMPVSFALEQNFPNPFNPSTTIRYRLPATVHANLSVYNMLGQQVATLVDGIQEAGEHSITFSGFTLTSGVYMYRLSAGAYSEQKKLLLLK